MRLLSDIERTIEESGCVNHEGEIMDCVRCASEVDAAPVVRGEWIRMDETQALLSVEWNAHSAGKRYALTAYSRQLALVGNTARTAEVTTEVIRRDPLSNR